MERIHVVGLGPRTGTTLIAEAMIACFGIDAYDTHEAGVSHLRRNAGIYLSKRPGDLPAVQWRLRLDRHFHVICMMRDPRDTVVSRHGSHPDRYWVPLRSWKRQLVVARHLMGHERFILVRYEDLVADPDGTQAGIARRLPFLRAVDTFSHFHLRADPSGPARTALGGLRAVDRQRIGNWRRHLPRLAGQLARHGAITDELIALGYEKDAGWLSLLDGIEPDMTPSHLGETPSWRTGYRRARAQVRAGVSLAVLFSNRLTGRQIG
jgi:hypothetical protein